MEILALERPCPKCKAKATEPCKNEAGVVIHEVHSERWPTKKKAPREDDLNQTAARIVRDHQPKWSVTKASPAKKPPVNSDDVDALGYWEDDGGPVERGEHK